MTENLDFQNQLEPERYELPRRPRTVSKLIGESFSNSSVPECL
jgi:hypothetical protein